MATRELLVEDAGDHLLLRSPEVGEFTCALEKGRVCTPGMEAGVIRTLGRRTVLIVPAGGSGRVAGDPPERVLHPVGYGDVLYELAPVGGGEITASAGDALGAMAAENVFRSAHAGRFWHRPAPGEPPLAEPGTVLTGGDAVGLIEVMKTFGRVIYRPAGGLPPRARVVRVLAADGAEVNPGDPLVEVEPA